MLPASTQFAPTLEWSRGSGATTSGESTPSSQLSTKEYLQHLRELAEGKPELEAGLRHVEGLIAIIQARKKCIHHVYASEQDTDPEAIMLRLGLARVTQRRLDCS